MSSWWWWWYWWWYYFSYFFLGWAPQLLIMFFPYSWLIRPRRAERRWMTEWMVERIISKEETIPTNMQIQTGLAWIELDWTGLDWWSEWVPSIQEWNYNLNNIHSDRDIKKNEKKKETEMENFCLNRNKTRWLVHSHDDLMRCFAKRNGWVDRLELKTYHKELAIEPLSQSVSHLSLSRSLALKLTRIKIREWNQVEVCLPA